MRAAFTRRFQTRFGDVNFWYISPFVLHKEYVRCKPLVHPVAYCTKPQ